MSQPQPQSQTSSPDSLDFSPSHNINPSPYEKNPQSLNHSVTSLLHSSSSPSEPTGRENSTRPVDFINDNENFSPSRSVNSITTFSQPPINEYSNHPITKDNREAAVSLPVGRQTTKLINHPVSLIGEQQQPGNRNKNSWFNTDTSGRGGTQFSSAENVLPPESSIGLDGVIIGSSPQQNSDCSEFCQPTDKVTLPDNLIQISDKTLRSSPPVATSTAAAPTKQSVGAQLAQKLTTSPHSSTTAALVSSSQQIHPVVASGVSGDNYSRRSRFKSSLLDPAATSSTITPASTKSCDSSSVELNNTPLTTATTGSRRISSTDDRYAGLADELGNNQEEIPLETLHEDIHEEEDNNYTESDQDSDDEQQQHYHQSAIGRFESYTKFNSGSKGPSSTLRKLRGLVGGHTFLRIQRLVGVFNSKLIDSQHYKETPYVHYESKDLLTGDSKYPAGRKSKKLGSSSSSTGGKTFRGSYKYSRAEISMAIFKKLINLLFHKSTLALLGAFLIHITLGTVYTLSNINSYMTSYMRLHGSPTLTYGGSMWISSLYAVGQGFSMVLGGYLEKRFSARLACFLGCIIHSGSIMGTSWALNHGFLAVLFSYGFLPGFGCGLAYMTPMSNGFGWFPNRRGLVAGVILAGFGIGTFVFNITQTAYVNPDNLSPPGDASGYFTQGSILTKVPGLFVFIGSIYAAMQFVGCCLLFRPPSYSDQLGAGGGKSASDERPILTETEVSVGRAIRTREFVVLFLVYGIITQGVLFVNSMIKEYGQLFIGDDMYLAWTGSMASIANALGRLFWGLAIDRYTFSQCFTCITCIFGSLMFLMPFEFVLSSKQLFLLCTLGIFGSFSGWMSTFPVHLSRTFGRLNSGMLYGLIFISQSLGGIASAFGAHYLIDHYTRFVPFFCVVFLEILGLAIYHLFYPKHRYL